MSGVKKDRVPGSLVAQDGCLIIRGPGKITCIYKKIIISINCKHNSHLEITCNKCIFVSFSVTPLGVFNCHTLGLENRYCLCLDIKTMLSGGGRGGGQKTSSRYLQCASLKAPKAAVSCFSNQQQPLPPHPPNPLSSWYSA